jgi:hypothetical protein
MANLKPLLLVLLTACASQESDTIAEVPDGAAGAVVTGGATVQATVTGGAAGSGFGGASGMATGGASVASLTTLITTGGSVATGGAKATGGSPLATAGRSGTTVSDQSCHFIGNGKDYGLCGASTSGQFRCVGAQCTQCDSALGKLDCDYDGICETISDDANCGSCGTKCTGCTVRAGTTTYSCP